MTVTDKILNEWSFRCHDGIVDLNDLKKVKILFEILEEDIDDDVLNALVNADDDTKTKVLKQLQRIGKEEEKPTTNSLEKSLQEKGIPENIIEFIILKAEKRNEISDLESLLNSKNISDLGKEGKLDAGKLNWINTITITQSSLSLGKGEILLAIMLVNSKIAKTSKYDLDVDGKPVEIKQSSIDEKGVKSGAIISGLGRSDSYKIMWDIKDDDGISFKQKYFGEKYNRKLSSWSPVFKLYNTLDSSKQKEFIFDLQNIMVSVGFKDLNNINNDSFKDEKHFCKVIASCAVGDYLNNKTLILLSSQLEYIILDKLDYQDQIINNPDINANTIFIPRISYKESIEQEITENEEYGTI